MTTAYTIEKNIRPAPDKEFVTLADYVSQTTIQSEPAYSTARYCLMDSMGCAILALQYAACTKLLGPVVPGTTVPHGARVPGTDYILDPILAAFNIGTLIRWLDFNDTWLAAEWGHPSDNLGAILAVADYLSRKNIAEKKSPLLMRDVLTAMIKAYEIQGVLALENSFNRVGLDHVILVKVASAAVVMHMLGGNKTDVINVLSHAFIDGQSLRTYRHAPNTGSRKSWAAGDATSRAVRLAWMILKGEMGYPSALTAKTWGFYDVCFKQQPFCISRTLGSYVMENILFKISFPAEFHAQTAVECAIALHPKVKQKFDQIEKIVVITHESAMRIINKTGPLHNPADRDHCLQYMIAAGLVFGNLKAEYYEDDVASDPRMDALREKMIVEEDLQFSKDYLDPDKRSIANALQIYFNDGTKTEKITVEYPIGHKRRREEGIPLLIEKFENNMKVHFSDAKTNALRDMFQNLEEFEVMPVNHFMELIAK